MELININDSDKLNHALKVADALAKSSIVPMNFRGKPSDVFATLVLGAELGFQPMQSLNSIVMINGSATLKAQTMLAIARSKLPKMKLTISTKDDAIKVIGQRDEADTPYESIWDDARVAKMGLSGKDNYKKQDMTMKKWRALSDVLRTIAPDVIMGLHSTEEMLYLDVEKPDEVKVIDAINEDLIEYEARERKEHPEWYEIGGQSYRHQQGKFKGKMMSEIEIKDLEDYWHHFDKQEKDGKQLKDWQKEIKQSIDVYLSNI